MRDDYDEFVATGASVLAIAPESTVAIARFIKQHPVPFPIVSDADHHAFDASTSRAARSVSASGLRLSW